MKRRRGYLESMFQKLRPILNLTVVVASLGYFVDMFDLLLFPVLRQSSLTALGVTGDAQVATGAYLLNMQMAGMLLGGIFWGVLGDKKGRLSTLFGSIALYSIANIANAFVHSVPAYAFWRFAAGLGLAGELGAAVTLVSEVLPRDLRGYGTTIVAAVGIFGVVAASLVGKLMPWRLAYVVGGLLGITLLLMRVRMRESSMFHEVRQGNVQRGNFLCLFTSLERFGRYLRCILIGLPTWCVVGILVTFSPEFAVRLGVTGRVARARRCCGATRASRWAASLPVS
jgi:MFS transporter, putative metabolite:H+ symporter